MNNATLAALLVSFVVACGGSTASTTTPAKSASASPGSSEASVTPAKPAVDLAKSHLRDHVKYPATRAQILAACADTPEFTEGEKAWTAQHLPEGTYASADDVIAALGL
jgi:hypothetical protein